MDNPVKDNLKKLMRTDGQISEGELSRRTGVPQSTIHRILVGHIKESKPSTLRPLASYFGLSMAQLQGEEAIPLQRSASIISKEQTELNQYLGTPAHLIPLITWGQAAQWEKIQKDYQHDSTQGWIATNKNVGPYAFGLKVQGNSMSAVQGPSFEDGYEIVVDPDRKPQHHDYVVVRETNKQSAFLRQLSVEGSKYILFPLNPRYQVTQLESLKEVCGVVCQLLGTF